MPVILLNVAGVGIVSPVGLSARQTSAAVRAGLSNFAELKGIVCSTGEPVIAAEVPYRLFSPTKLNDLAMRALVEAIRDANPPRGTALHVAIVTAERSRPGQPVDVETLQADVIELLEDSHDLRFALYPYGHAGAGAAIAELAETLNQSNCMGLIVAADSLLSLLSLQHLERHGRLKSGHRVRGLIPGEAAAALVVAPVTYSPIRGSDDPCCRVAGIGTAMEPNPVGSEAPCLGEGLTTAIDAALASTEWRGLGIDRVFCDLNGEGYRTHEWMLVMRRSLQHRSLAHPADCIGDVGAASLPMSIGLAVSEIRRSGGPLERVMAWASSDEGLRSAVCLERA